jgi:hypothetical protein
MANAPVHPYPGDQMREEFIALARPLVKWLRENCHPHHTIIITPTNAELLEGELTGQITDYLRD